MKKTNDHAEPKKSNAKYKKSLKDPLASIYGDNKCWPIMDTKRETHKLPYKKDQMYPLEKGWSPYVTYEHHSLISSACLPCLVTSSLALALAFDIHVTRTWFG